MKNWLVVVLISCGLFAAAIFQYKTILSGYAEFFTVNNVTSGADAIVVLSGGKGTRIPHALKLFAEGFAPRLLLTEEKKRNLRFAHLFSTNEEIAQAMIDELFDQMLHHVDTALRNRDKIQAQKAREAQAYLEEQKDEEKEE